MRRLRFIIISTPFPAKKIPLFRHRYEEDIQTNNEEFKQVKIILLTAHNGYSLMNSFLSVFTAEYGKLIRENCGTLIVR